MRLPAPDPVSYRRRTVYVVSAALCGFAFFVSYTHIYDLGLAYGQHGWAARLLPLSVDLLLVAATLVMYERRQVGGPQTRVARGLPRVLLWAGIAGTVAANVAYGLPYGWLGAVISAWPGAVFAGVVEMVIVSVPPRPREVVSQTVKTAGQRPVPSTSYEAAAIAYAASVQGGNPLKEYELHKRFGIPRSQSRKIVAPPAPEPPAGAVPATPVPAGLNGHGPGGDHDA